MNTTKHTPGRWVSKQLGNTGTGAYAIFYVIETGTSKATLRLDSYGKARGEYSKEDAALIAAAPELLEALKMLERRYTFQEDDAATVQAAIAKAEGR